MCDLFDYAGYAPARAPIEAKKKRKTSSFHTYAVFLSLGLIFWFFSRSFFFWDGEGGEAKIHLKLFSLHFCMAAARAPVETKKKQDISSLHTYAVFLSWDLTLPSLLTRSLYTHNSVPLFDYLGYAAARAPDEAKKKQDLSFFHTYAVFLSLGFIFQFCSRILLGMGGVQWWEEGRGRWSKNWFKTFFITFLYGSQTSGQNEEKTRYIIISHIRSVSQLRPYHAFSAS